MSRTLVLCLALLLPVAAVAQTIDQQAAGALQQDLQSWFAGLLGPNPGVAPQKLRVTAEDDHFRVALPFADASGDNEISADVRPLEAGRWSIDALRFPAASRFTLRVPPPLGLPPGSPDGDALTRFALSIGTQSSHGVVDPAFASASRLDVDLGNFKLVSDGPNRHQEQYVDHYVMQATLEPHNGRVDFSQQGTLTGWRSASRIGDRMAVAFGADRIQGHDRVDGIDRTHAMALLTAASGLIAALPAASAAPQGDVLPRDGALSPSARAALRALIGSLRGVVMGVQADETMDGVHLAIAGQGEATVHQLRLGFDGAAPDGMLHAVLTIGLDGLAVQNAPPQAAALMPSHLELRPSIAGVSLADLTTLALEATDQGADPARLQADAAALLAHGGVAFGLDAADMDVGPAEMHGHGKVLVRSPDDYRAEAHITATGLDALIEQARGNPNLRRILPLLAIARGFARSEGDHLAWDIVASKSGVTVNGIELGNPRVEKGQPDRR